MEMWNPVKLKFNYQQLVGLVCPKFQLLALTFVVKLSTAVRSPSEEDEGKKIVEEEKEGAVKGMVLFVGTSAPCIRRNDSWFCLVELRSQLLLYNYLAFFGKEY
ncbi:unnamed protein product [Sphenostylis stenocarpa]|uniref:Uncharacterized protein n=1 Tax=Sphenostylis stenocarpa TaxID=92480 RepID=A0AA86SUK6_9FABA|nr:unnamed protein product [Sphenostylis stenocarpa]